MKKINLNAFEGSRLTKEEMKRVMGGSGCTGDRHCNASWECGAGCTCNSGKCQCAC